MVTVKFSQPTTRGRHSHMSLLWFVIIFLFSILFFRQFITYEILVSCYLIMMSRSWRTLGKIPYSNDPSELSWADIFGEDMASCRRGCRLLLADIMALSCVGPLLSIPTTICVLVDDDDEGLSRFDNISVGSPRLGRFPETDEFREIFGESGDVKWLQWTHNTILKSARSTSINYQPRRKLELGPVSTS